ncbi:MAG: CCA tRNA nucleotidyltransferase, mitochondrial [Thelocarpon impressellum]|nr:MAG: CCA tRNA nucleotidyltransferase, mitochondrial [Thelocarpon impressellum]
MASASAPDTGHELPSGLELTELEATLRRLLLDVAHHIDTLSTPPSSGSEVALPPSLKDAKVELRFTGGWVRDKLLRVGSHDIDVAVNKMTGYQFGKHMIDYINIPGNRDKYHVSNSSAISDNQGAEGQDASSRGLSMGDLHKIEANPEKSKHLETVTTRILGLDVDIVNLRKESYTEDSRNPQMEFGTPEEDALRRDATVNALFYNLNTSKLEDFTGKGFDDLGNKIMRTPMEPHQTFKDDPLRVLRMIRFASRLGYSIHHDAEAAMSAAAIKQALKAKISRERVGVEVEKMLRDDILKEYVLFLEHLKERDLLDVTTLRPLMDGKELSKSLDLKPGKWMKEALEVVMAWQLRHPGSQDTNAAVEEVRRHKETLGLP